MHPHAALIEKLYTCLNTKDHAGMASCYDPKATFHDIAFDLDNREQIHAMWHMISETDLRATFTVGPVDDEKGFADLVDDYTFHNKPGDKGKPVHNVIKSEFHFREGRIIKHVDDCDPLTWGRQALGPVVGTVAGLIPAARQAKAKTLLRAFIHPAHPEYAHCGL